MCNKIVLEFQACQLYLNIPMFDEEAVYYIFDQSELIRSSHCDIMIVLCICLAAEIQVGGTIQ